MRYPDTGGVSAKQRGEREGVRLEAAEMLEKGIKPSIIAKTLRVSTKSAYRWRRQWRAGGTEALLSKGPGGATCQLTDERLGWLRADLDAGPAVFGWVDDQRWTAARVTDLVFDRYKVRYTGRGMAYLLRRIGFTPRVPVRRAVKRDEAAIEAWVKEVWPVVKAPRRPRGAGSSSSAPRGAVCPNGGERPSIAAPS
jgi:putative transposase